MISSRSQASRSIANSLFSRSAIRASTWGTRALSDAIALDEESTAVTSHPWSASQRVLRPFPHARSSALPGGRSPVKRMTSCSGESSGRSMCLTFEFILTSTQSRRDAETLYIRREFSVSLCLCVEITNLLKNWESMHRRHRSCIGELIALAAPWDRLHACNRTTDLL